MIGIFIMFCILFKNIKLSLIGVVPNFLAAFFILGIIGLLNIPRYDTITIAAITIGIAVIIVFTISTGLKKSLKN